MRLYVGAGLTRELILGVDVGTSSVKALFIELSGNILRRTEVKHETKTSGKAYAEQDARGYLSSLQKISIENSDLIGDVVAIGLSGHTPSVVCIDGAGNPTRPVLTWQDNRSTVEAEALALRFANPLNTVGTSLPWAASACAAKLFWLSNNEPETKAKTRWVLQPKDFVGFHLTGNAISDPWSTKGICNVISRTPIFEVLDFVGWSSDICPELMDGYQSRGTLSVEAARYFKLPVGIPVSVGWSDAMCGMLAMGVMTEPTSFIITGTSAIVGASSSTPPKDGGGLYVIPDTCAPLAVTYGPTQSSGSSVEWAASMLGVDSDEFIDMAIKSKSTDLPMYLPYIDGERAPLWRPDVRGGFYSMSITSQREDIAASVLEGIGFAERQVLNIAENLNGSRTQTIKLGGHAGNDGRGEAIRLRTLGRAVERFVDTDTTNRGSAILALAVLTGNLQESVKALSFKPNRVNPSESDQRYSERRNLEFLLLQSQAVALADFKL
jgi:xylulokinase